MWTRRSVRPRFTKLFIVHARSLDHTRLKDSNVQSNCLTEKSSASTAAKNKTARRRSARTKIVAIQGHEQKLGECPDSCIGALPDITIRVHLLDDSIL